MNSAYGGCDEIEHQKFQSNPSPRRLCQHVMPSHVKPNYKGNKKEWSFLDEDDYLENLVDSTKKHELCKSFGCCYVQLKEDGPHKCIMPSKNITYSPITIPSDTYYKVKLPVF